METTVFSQDRNFAQSARLFTFDSAFVQLEDTPLFSMTIDSANAQYTVLHLFQLEAIPENRGA